MQQQIQEQVGAELIRGEINTKTPGKKPNFVYLHGSAKTNGFDFPLVQNLVQRDISVLTFNFSGTGRSSGSFEQSTIKKRVEEATAIISKYADLANLTLCGTTMGAHLAIKMIDSFRVKSLVLFSPAIYDARAFDVPFDNRFQEIIQAYRSWNNSDALESLRRFRGQLLMILGDSDDVIPVGVMELIDKSAHSTSRKEAVFLPNCDHKIFPWLKDHPKETEAVADRIAEYVKAAELSQIA